MLQKCYPDAYVSSIDAIDFVTLYQQGYRGLLLDIDNTLVPHGANADSHAKQLLNDLRQMGYRICLVSNNDQARVERFNQQIQVEAIYRAHKPARSAYQRAMEKIGTQIETTIFVGDQIFTDIFGAKRMGIRNYLVKPLNPKEEFQIVCKRIPEKLVLFFYQRKKRQK